MFSYVNVAALNVTFTLRWHFTKANHTICFQNTQTTPLSPPRQFLVFGNYKNNHFKCNNVGHKWLGCIFSAIFACKVDHKASHTISFIFFLSVAVCSIPWGHNATQLLQHILFDIDVQLGWEMIMRSWFCSRQNMSKMGFAILLESVRSFAAFAFSRLFSHVRLSCFSSRFFFFSPAFSCDTECITGADTSTHKFLAQWAWTPPLVRHIGLRLHFLTALSGSGKSPEK